MSNNIIDLQSRRQNEKLRESMLDTVQKFSKETFTKKEVQDLINRIIHQDSFGDIFFHAGKVMRGYNMKMIDPRNSDNIS